MCRFMCRRFLLRISAAAPETMAMPRPSAGREREASHQSAAFVPQRCIRKRKRQYSPLTHHQCLDPGKLNSGLPRGLLGHFGEGLRGMKNSPGQHPERLRYAPPPGLRAAVTG